MKKISHRQMYFLLVCCMTAFCALLTSCKNDTIGSPVITAVRNYVASPNDTIINSAVAKGQWVVIEGKYLQDALQISFDGVPATFNNALFSSDHAVVQIPAILFSTIDMNKLYTIEYKTTTGTASFSFKLGPEAPTITAISDVFANPGDSVFLYGTNLVLVENLTYGGAKISSYKSNLDGTSLGFVMPSPAPTSGKVLLTTKSGATSFDILALPTITGVSNENAVPGDSVYVYGTYLKGVQTFTFGGVAITSYKLAAKGNSIGFVLPSSVHTGPASVTTVFGTATTVYDVYNQYNVQYVGSATTGVLANMEWGDAFGWGWWGGANLSVSDAGRTGGWLTLCADMATNPGMFMSINEGTLAAGAKGSSIPLGAAQWIPAANMNDPVDNWAIKFEINIPKAWNGGSVCIQSGFSGSYTARYEPWQISSTATAAYTTKGWTTVTIPLSMFRAKDATLGEGKGASVTTLANLLGPTGNAGCSVFINNYGTSATTTGFYGGFDNFRVVKIK
jgi:signal peptidase I